jgi:hypothetical protein
MREHRRFSRMMVGWLCADHVLACIYDHAPVDKHERGPPPVTMVLRRRR